MEVIKRIFISVHILHLKSGAYFPVCSIITLLLLFATSCVLRTIFWIFYQCHRSTHSQPTFCFCKSEKRKAKMKENHTILSSLRHCLKHFVCICTFFHFIHFYTLYLVSIRSRTSTQSVTYQWIIRNFYFYFLFSLDWLCLLYFFLAKVLLWFKPVFEPYERKQMWTSITKKLAKKWMYRLSQSSEYEILQIRFQIHCFDLLFK